MAKMESAIASAKFAAKQNHKEYVAYRVRNGQWLFSSLEYWENTECVKNPIMKDCPHVIITGTPLQINPVREFPKLHRINVTVISCPHAEGQTDMFEVVYTIDLLCCLLPFEK